MPTIQRSLASLVDCLVKVINKAKLLVGLQFGLIALLVFAPAIDPSWEFAWARNIAIILYFSAILIFALAAYALQPSLRVNPIPKPGAPLITHGIYEYLRHPMYFAVMLIGTGLLIQKFNPVTVLIWLGLGMNMSFKAKYEDQLLRANHAAAKTYQLKTPDLLGKRFE